MNQIEVHPYFTNDAVRAFGYEHQIVTEGWSPLKQGEVLDDIIIGEIAAREGKTPAQVVLRWHLQRGDVIFPRRGSGRGWKKTSICSTLNWILWISI